MSGNSKNHEETCDFHQSPSDGLCFSKTQAGKACQHLANFFTPGFLPVCGRHKRNQIDLPAGQCQAIEDCGHLCNRLAARLPPYNFCTKHEDGSDRLPCHIMELPTELRLMIFRYLFPEKIYAAGDMPSTLLHVNRQIHQEAASVLYGESHFHGSISLTGIRLRGKQWHGTYTGNIKAQPFSTGKPLHRESARRIRNLDLKICMKSLDLGVPKNIGTFGLTVEEYTIYSMRDNVRKLVELMTVPSTSQSGQCALRKLSVTIVRFSESRWSAEEAIHAIFLVVEPLQSLRGLKAAALTIETFEHDSTSTLAGKITAHRAFRHHQEKWAKSLLLQAPTTTPVPEPNPLAKETLDNIERLYHLVHQRVTLSCPGRSWILHLHAGIERPLHYARVAYESGDIPALQHICEAIKIRWVNAHRVEQKSLQLVADSINDMCVDVNRDLDLEPPREAYPDAFEFDDQEPLSDRTVPDPMWADLASLNPPVVGSPGVKVKVDKDSLRVRIEKGGREWICLATPAVVREMQNMDESMDEST